MKLVPMYIARLISMYRCPALKNVMVVKIKFQNIVKEIVLNLQLYLNNMLLLLAEKKIKKDIDL